MKEKAPSQAVGCTILTCQDGKRKFWLTMKRRETEMKKRAHVRGHSPVIFLLAIALAGPPVALAGGFCPNFPSYIPIWSTTYNGHVLCFVGSDPRDGPFTSTIPTIVIPVELRYLNAKGKVVETSDPTGPL